MKNMSKAQRRVGKYSPDDCAVIRTSLLSKHLSSEKLRQRPVELDDDKKKTPCFCVLEQGVFPFRLFRSHEWGWNQNRLNTQSDSCVSDSFNVAASIKMRKLRFSFSPTCWRKRLFLLVRSVLA